MSDSNIKLTRKQQELLLRGLRYVRSSVALEMQDYSEKIAEQRQRQYAEISAMETMVNGAKIIEPAAV